MSLFNNTQGGGTGGASASIFVTGLSEADTVTATKDGKTVQGKWGTKKNQAFVLPDGYKQLEYIESTGDQWVNTKWMHKADSKLVLYCNVTATTRDSWICLFGSMNPTYNTQALTFFTRFDSKNIPALARTGNETQGTNMIYGKDIVITVEGNTATWTDGTVTYSVTSSGTADDGGVPLYLFANNVSGAATRMAVAKVFRAEHYVGGELVGCLVPTRQELNSTVGLYDVVSGEFLPNSGTGEFIAGAEIPSAFDGHTIPIKDCGMWTVTATNGEKTTTQDVLVDVAMDYDIEMVYALWLFNEGDQCTDVTGGWSCYAGGPYSGTAEIQSDRIYISQTSWYTAGISTANKIDITKYSALKCLYSLSQTKTTGNGAMYLCVADAKNTERYNNSYSPYPNTGNADAIAGTNVVGTNQILSVDITNVSGARYPILTGGGSNEAGLTLSVYQIWLE